MARADQFGPPYVSFEMQFRSRKPRVRDSDHRRNRRDVTCP